MKQTVRSIIFIIGTLGWWGFVYPDLCLTPEEYAADSKTDVAWESKPEEVCIKSRFYEYVCQIREKG